MRAQYRIFRGSFRSWEGLFDDAANFASSVGRDRLISISHSEDQNEGVVVVWYWSSADAPDETFVAGDTEGRS